MIGIRPGGHRVLLGALAWYGVFTLLYSLIQHPRVMESLQGLLTFLGSVTSYRWSNRLLLLLVVTWGLHFLKKRW